MDKYRGYIKDGGGPPDLFDAAEGVAAADAGIERVEEANPNFVAIMRVEAIRLATLRGSVTADDLRLYAADHGIAPVHPNAWGAVFRDRRFEAIDWAPSQLESNHGRAIRVWKLYEAGT